MYDQIFMFELSERAWVGVFIFGQISIDLFDDSHASEFHEAMEAAGA